MEDRPRFQTGPREIRPSGIIGGPRETWPGWNCAPSSHTERARMVTLHLYTGAPELYPNNPRPIITDGIIDSKKPSPPSGAVGVFVEFGASDRLQNHLQCCR